MSRHQIYLFYGYEEGEDGIYHSFHAADPEAPIDDDWIENYLADLLDCRPTDDRFDFNCMYVDLPESLVERIKAEAVAEYKASLENETFGGVTWNREDIEKAIKDCGYAPSDSRIETVWDEMIARGQSNVIERMCEAGWDALYNTISILAKEKGWNADE